MIQNTSKNCNKNFNIFDELHDNPPPKNLDIPLAVVSERDSVWDTHRNQASLVDELYRHNFEFEKYSNRISECSGLLEFGSNNGEFVLVRSSFCRVRYCPVCQWRKSLYWKAIMYQNFEKLRQEYPKHRFIFLTLTVKNPHISDLRQTLQHMNKSWKRLTMRKEFSVVDGWIRTTEVTRDKDRPNTHAHPHFHVILMVKASYFTHNYIKQMQWVRLWQDCLQVDYMPNVDVRAVKSKNQDEDAIKSAIAETLKYSTKPSELIQNKENKASREWFFELTRQTHKLRFVATGGALKDVLKKSKDEKTDEPTNQDLITIGNDETKKIDDRRIYFKYNPPKKSYLLTPNDPNDKPIFLASHAINPIKNE